MASAEVLPSAAAVASSLKKQELLKAGKRTLEEFRKKKASEKAKKAASTSRFHDLNEKEPIGTVQVQQIYLNGTSVVGSDQSTSSTNGYGSKDQTHVNYQEVGDHDSFNASSTTPVYIKYCGKYKDMHTDPVIDYGAQKGFKVDQPVGFHGISLQDTVESSVKFKSSSLKAAEPVKDMNFPNGFIFQGPHSTHDTASPDSFGAYVPQCTVDQASGLASLPYEEPSHKVEQNECNAVNSDHLKSVEMKSSSLYGILMSPYSSSLSASTSEISGCNMNGSSPNHNLIYSAAAGISDTRPYPCFLDSISQSKASSYSHFPVERVQSQPILSSSSEGNGSPHTALSGPWTLKEQKIVETNNYFDTFEKPTSTLASSNNDSYHHEPQYRSSKPDEDFAALEQHIEDMTQEKFSFQRGLEAARSLAESLAAENSSLTESYNQQGAFVNQLSSEMGNLQEEIKIQMSALEAIQMECTNAQLECRAADERAKLLAAEVIALEEKALRLRSNELKLEKQLESALSETSSNKNKISRLERERQELQEHIGKSITRRDKMLLQSKIQKSSLVGNFIDSSKYVPVKKDVSTSTEYMDDSSESSNTDVHNIGSFLGDDTSSSVQQLEDREFSLETASMGIPFDQQSVINNINLLISELSAEKEELIQALESESALTSQLKEWNKDLSCRLEIQTQRLELMTAQSMACENHSARHPDLLQMHNTITVYADEGDEVVERVLGWIMKLSPGDLSSTSRRRMSI